VRPRPAAARLALLALLAAALAAVAVATANRPAGRRGAGPAAVAGPVPAAGGFFPVGPVTVARATPLPPGGAVTVALTGIAGVPPEGVEAVVLSLRATPAASGRLAVAGGDLPARQDDPGVALSAGEPASASLLVAVPSDGRVRLANQAPGATTVAAAVDGWYGAPCGGGGAGYQPAGGGWAAPRRATVGPGRAASVPVADGDGAVAVALQVRVQVRAGDLGAVRVGPDQSGAADQPAGGFQVVRPGPGGRVRLANQGGGAAAVNLRVLGWYRRGAAAGYRTAGPEPLLDATVPAGGSASFAAAGVAGLPAGGVAAAALEVQAAAAAGGTLQLAGEDLLALAAGRAASGFTLAPPGPGGRLEVRNRSAAPARVTVRARGWQGGPAPLRAAADPATLALFGRGAGVEPGWAGGDGNVPVRLPDGRTAWLFGDSFYGTVAPGGGRRRATLVRNAVVVQDGGRLQTHTGPTDRAGGPVSSLLVPPDGAGSWLWPGTGLVDGGRLQVFLQEFRRPAGSDDPAAFEWTGRNLLAELSLPDLVPLGVAPVYGGAPGAGGVGWGTAVLQAADFTYLYGVEDSAGPLHVKYAHLARFPRGGARGPWAFWDGGGWSPDPARSARLVGAAAAGGLEQLTGTPSAVVPAGASYLELTIPDGGHEVLGRLACSPAGPWGPARVLYRIPQRATAYLARAYPDGPGLLLAYSLAPADQRELFTRASAYVPGFVRVR
jgi:hypothetical protein